jgi:hypothetical protein
VNRPAGEPEQANGLTDWLDEVSGPGWIWFVKILSANDTYAKSNVHQGGPYVAKEVLRVVFPMLSRRAVKESNPDLQIPTKVGIGAEETAIDLRLVWYNSKRLGQSNGRDEARLTRWGGFDAPVVNAASTGSLAVFAYHQSKKTGDADALRVWVSRDADDEDQITARVGVVEPGAGILVTPSGLVVAAPSSVADLPCRFDDRTLPKSWRGTFPTGAEIIREVVERLPSIRSVMADGRLMRRRDCEYEMFRSVERYYVLPRLQEKFATVDLFVAFAHAVTNRRKSRSGRSLELQLSAIFEEDDLSFSNGATTEGARRPDFIFPSIEKYYSSNWPASRLRMLGAKTTVKDRWRQILNEARRIERKHLLTLQEGVSREQFKEMQDEGVTLVVPTSIQRHYPKEVIPGLMSVSQFIADTKRVCGV